MTSGRTRTVTFRDRGDKLGEVGLWFAPYLVGTVLDVGCDTRQLADAVRGRYIGLDIAGKPDVTADLNQGLPFLDRSFDAVIAFDVLEHVDDIHYAFDELCRVSRGYLIIGLPNLYEWRFRLAFLLGRGLGGKYGLPAERPTDRHHWFFGLPEARTFVRRRGESNGFRLLGETLAYYAYRRIVPRLITALTRRWAPRGAELFAYHYWALLKRGTT